MDASTTDAPVVATEMADQDDASAVAMATTAAAESQSGAFITKRPSSKNRAREMRRRALQESANTGGTHQNTAAVPGIASSQPTSMIGGPLLVQSPGSTSTIAFQSANKSSQVEETTATIRAPGAPDAISPSDATEGVKQSTGGKNDPTAPNPYGQYLIGGDLTGPIEDFSFPPPVPATSSKRRSLELSMMRNSHGSAQHARVPAMITGSEEASAAMSPTRRSSEDAQPRRPSVKRFSNGGSTSPRGYGTDNAPIVLSMPMALAALRHRKSQDSLSSSSGSIRGRSPLVPEEYRAEIAPAPTRRRSISSTPSSLSTSRQIHVPHPGPEVHANLRRLASQTSQTPFMLQSCEESNDSHERVDIKPKVSTAASAAANVESWRQMSSSSYDQDSSRLASSSSIHGKGLAMSRSILRSSILPGSTLNTASSAATPSMMSTILLSEKNSHSVASEHSSSQGNSGLGVQHSFSFSISPCQSKTLPRGGQLAPINQGRVLSNTALDENATAEPITAVESENVGSPGSDKDETKKEPGKGIGKKVKKFFSKLFNASRSKKQEM